MPVLCPSCGASVTVAMRACAVCGAANPAAKFPTTLTHGTPSEGALSSRAARAFASVPPQAARSCAKCNARLGPSARFCQRCGEAVDESVRLQPEPSRENVVALPQPAPEREPEPVPREAERPARHLTLAFLDEELDALTEERPHPPKLQDIDYLDALLGQKAPGAEAPPKAPAWRLGRRPVAPERAHEPLPESSGEFVPTSPDSLAPPSERRSLAIPGAVGFAIFALGMVVLVHLFAPSAIPGYSSAELDLRVEMRAVEWLLGAILSLLFGILFKR